MVKKQTTKEKVSMTLPIGMRGQFKSYCDKKGYKISSRVAILIQLDMNKNA